VSAGLSYQMTSQLALDFAYSHIFVKSTAVSISAASGNPWFNGVTYNGTVASHADIASVALRYRWDAASTSPKRM